MLTCINNTLPKEHQMSQMMTSSKRKSITIGIVINSAVKPSRDVMLGIMDFIREYPGVNYRLFLASAATLPEHLVEFASSGVDGLIFSGVRRDIDIGFGVMMPNHPPAVLCIYSPLTDEERAILGNGGTVMLDNVALGQQAAAFFFTHGLQNFAFFGSHVYRERIAGEIRCEAFRQHLEAKFGTQLRFSSLMEGTGYANEDFWDDKLSKIEAWVKSLTCPCGIFVNGDREAFGLIETCRKLGISVPGQIEVLSVNNSIGLCEVAVPAISSIIPDHRICAFEAIKMLLAIIDNPKLPPDQRMVTVSSHQLVERGTTLSGRGYGQLVTRAREYIRLNACSGIGVMDVVRNLGVSQRTLEKRVYESTGQSIHAMIRTIRLEKVCQLLTKTDLPISEVTTRAGYRLTTSLGALFKKTFGMSMRQYRNAGAGVAMLRCGRDKHGPPQSTVLPM